MSSCRVHIDMKEPKTVIHIVFLYKVNGVLSEEERRNRGEALWCTLTQCDANYAMKKQLRVRVTASNLKSSP